MASLHDLIDAWQDKRILVAGDPGYDVYHFGHVDRISPEAPVPVFVEDAIEDRPGLAYNVCQNLAALGCNPVQCFPPQPWTVKRRFMVGTHQLLRVDKDQIHHPTPNDLPDLDGIDCIILSDYAKGWLKPEWTQRLVRNARDRLIPVVVDPKEPDWSKFKGCSVICPNEKEWLASSSWVEPNVLIKRGEHGIRYVGHSDIQDFQATARHVFDVTGAGDTVCAVVAATLTAGGDLPTACRLANLAAGWVVGEVGTTACSADTLRSLCA